MIYDDFQYALRRSDIYGIDTPTGQFIVLMGNANPFDIHPIIYMLDESDNETPDSGLTAIKPPGIGEYGVYKPISMFAVTGSPTNIFCGKASLSNGEVTISNSRIKSNSLVIVTLNTASGILGAQYCVSDSDISSGTSFKIKAVDATGAVVTTDTSIVNWWIFKI